MIMELQQGVLLQGGKYRVEKKLAQGGFGITYLGWQVALNREIVIKEFFMKDYCNRDAGASGVSVGSEGSRELVARFRQKFLKEAQTIASMDDPRIIRIYDIFEENGTAYYVMEYVNGGSLKDLVMRHGALPERDALNYLHQIAGALSYVHARKVLHLDVKPSNVLLRENGNIVLIDFGISKRYDEQGYQTSSTPVGLSKGYAPLEQYLQGGMEMFHPCTDIYSLCATGYFMLTGNQPPEAALVNEEGLPPFPSFVSPATATAIRCGMTPRAKDRPQTVKDFLLLLDGVSESIQKTPFENTGRSATPPPPPPIPQVSGVSHAQKKEKSSPVWLAVAIPLQIVFLALFTTMARDMSIDYDTLPLTLFYAGCSFGFYPLLLRLCRRKMAVVCWILTALFVINTFLLLMWNGSLVLPYVVLSVGFGANAIFAWGRKLGNW